MLFSYHVLLYQLLLLHLYILLLFLFNKYIVIIQKVFYTAWYYMVTLHFKYEIK